MAFQLNTINKKIKMNINFTKIGLGLVFTLFTINVNAQEPKKEEKKIQEVVQMDADPKPVTPNPDGSVPAADGAAPGPMKQQEILKRAVNFVKIETPKYTKANGVTTGTKAECLVTFIYKPKELNPQSDVEGTFTMHVSIEAKEGKYRYTISKIKHVSKNAEYSGGDVNNEVPECGSMKLSPDMWKKIRSQANKHAAVVVADLKEAMKISSDTPVNSEEW